MVKVRGRNSHGKTVKQTAKNGRKISGDDAVRLAWVTGAGVSSSRLCPDSDRSRIWRRARPWLVCDSLNELTYISFLVHWHLTIFFCRFVSVSVWQDDDRVQCVAHSTWYSGRSSMSFSDSWLIDIGERSHPKPMHRKCSAGRCHRTCRPNKVGVVFLLRGLTTMCQKSTAHEQRRSRAESRKRRFGSNCTTPKIWQEGQHALYSPTQPIDWREHTIGAVHDRNVPTRSLQVQESCEKFLWHRVKVRSIMTFFPCFLLCVFCFFFFLCAHLHFLISFLIIISPSKKKSKKKKKNHDRTASRWWARWRSQSSSCQHYVITWHELIPADHEYLDSVAWPCMIARWHQRGTMTSQMLARASFSAVCLTVFPVEFRPRTFTIGFYGKKSFISELMILECSFLLRPSSTCCINKYAKVKWPIRAASFHDHFQFFYTIVTSVSSKTC